MGDAMVCRYWCYMCSQMVNPRMEANQIKCPFCDGEFLEEMSSSMGNSINNDIDAGSDRALSLWAPILLRLMGGFGPPRPRIAAHEHVASNEAEQEREFESFLRRRRRRDSSAPFSRPGLDLLLQHLLGNDSNRYGTPPAHKEVVRAMPMVTIDKNLQCSVCLEDFEMGSEAKEMPCKHKFHNQCILRWLELHSSCPVCRFQLPSDNPKVEGNGTGNREESIGNENPRNSLRLGTGEERAGNGRRYWIPVPWPFDGLFSLSGSQRSGSSSESSAAALPGAEPAAHSDEN
ncbi:E3 ubiquitin-protein ligase RING1-like [Melia azedarach]|uniref:E3 ubiquitin-protein ligase RING1-like n=1 Tax=Melia azedarach TaxID=155640 RepID=A0ACC1YBT3_MELAZ|nr:E3 ubiquitin-protein ligase RING1-like [Melia azedarach]